MKNETGCSGKFHGGNLPLSLTQPIDVFPSYSSIQKRRNLHRFFLGVYASIRNVHSMIRLQIFPAIVFPRTFVASGGRFATPLSLLTDRGVLHLTSST